MIVRVSVESRARKVNEAQPKTNPDRPRSVKPAIAFRYSCVILARPCLAGIASGFAAMTKRFSLLGAMALVILAGCSKPAPTPPVEEQAAASPVQAEPQPPPPSMGPADYPAKLIPLIDDRPECQQFRVELEEAGKVQSDQPLPVDMNEVNNIVAKAFAAGCGRKEPRKD